MKPKVFIGSSTEALPVAEAAQKQLSNLAEVEIWQDGKFSSTRTAIESLFAALVEYHFAVFVTVPEDVTTKRGVSHHTMRDNVLFEMGLFLGRLGRDRVFLIAPKDAALHLPSDLTGIDPATYDRSAKLLSAVGVSLYELKETLREFVMPNVVFDAPKNSKDQLVCKAGRQHDVSGTPISKYATADFKQTNDALEVTRTNSEGHWAIDVRPYGGGEPTIRKTPRRHVRVAFEAKVTVGETHVVRCVTINASTWAWIKNRDFTVIENDWKGFDAILEAPSDIDILVRLQEEVAYSPSGTLYIRNIVVTSV